ncbi:MAG: hypothetical protein JNM72_19075 [Deltaproteobacteria bacterium]|nr:hypothetical protein [Deltaproteobacteria bacterium]
MQGELPRPPIPDCDVGITLPKVPMRAGRMRGVRQPPRARKPWTLLLANLPGGIEMDGDDLLGGLLSLRRALGRGVRGRHGVTTARRPPMIEAPPSPSSDTLVALGRWSSSGLVGSTGISRPTLRLRYRSTEVHLPAAWVSRYLDRWLDTRGEIPAPRDSGPISGVGHVMDMFWPRFRARALRLRRGSYGRLIGCWGLPVAGDPDLPPTLFFNGTGGALRAVHELTCQLLHAYVDEIRVPHDTTTSASQKLVDDDGWCNNLHGFIEAILEGWPFPALDGNAARPTARPELPCGNVIIHYMDNVTNPMGPKFVNPCAGPGTGWTNTVIDCFEHSTDSDAWKNATIRMWDDYTLTTRKIASTTTGLLPGIGAMYVHFQDGQLPGPMSQPWPKSQGASTARASPDRRAVSFTPAHLAFDAELVDTLLFMAQLCLDRARHLVGGSEPLRRTTDAEAVMIAHAGSRFAAYALGPIAKRASILAHELGHVFLGGTPHCGFDLDSGIPRNRWRSCFDVAAETFYGRVIAENGLPIDPYVALDAHNSVVSTADPDFWSRGPDERDLDRTLWVTQFFPGIPSCNLVVDGEEHTDFTEPARDRARPLGVCVGRQRLILNAPGRAGGGFAVQVSNGCDCLVPVIPHWSHIDGISYSIDTTAPCLSTTLGTRGVYVLRNS